MNNVYIRLMRLDKPIGSLLLWYPTAWALWLANRAMPPLHILVLFLLGTILMRSAGCVVNDIADRNFDKHVSRTEKRPLTTGELSLKSALIVLVILLGLALLILMNLPIACIKYALIALGLTVVYPLCKRFINTPQLVLGLAFSMGIPMAYAASGVTISGDAELLFIINILWIVAYDTVYAMADKKDDLRIGIKSTAIYFGDSDKLIVKLIQVLMHSLWLILGCRMQVSWPFYPLWILAGLVLLWQQSIIKESTQESYIRAFINNNYYGAIIWFAIVLGLR